MVRHSGVKSFKCPDCQFRAFTSGAVRTHSKSMHSSEKTKVCPYCPFRAKTSSHLSGHIDRHHLRDIKMKQIKCEKCNFVTDDPKNMKEHNAEHGEAIFQCKECSSKFKSPRRLKNHVKNAHNEKKQKMFPCSHCNEEFKSKARMNAHMAYVTGVMPFYCRICNAGYLFMGALRKHFDRDHHDQFIFFCQACEFGCNFIKERRAHEGGYAHHMKIKLVSSKETNPTTNTAQKCDKCAYSTNCLATLKRHLSIKHRIIS